MSDLSQTKILEVTDTYCEVFIQHYNHIEANLNPDLQTNETLRNATLYAFLVDFALYFRHENQEEKHFEIAYFEGENSEKHKYSSNFYDEEEAKKVIEKVDILEWHFDTVWTKDMFENTQNSIIKAMYEEDLKSNEIFGLTFDWDDFLENVPRNFFTAKVFFKDKKYLIGFEKGMQNASTLDTFANEWL